MKRKVVAVVLVAAMALSLATGCGAKEESKDGKVKLRFASWDNAEDLDTQQKLVDSFNESHDDIEVMLEAYGDEYDTKISAGMGSGDTPDVMYMWDFPAYSGGLEPLGSYIEEEGEGYKANFYEELWPYNSIEEDVFGIPVGFTTHCLYYNKDIFDQAGLEYPGEDWTWDDVEKASKTITEKVEGTKGLAFPMKPDPYDFEMYFWSNGSSYIDKDGNLEGALNSDKSIKALDTFQKMQKDEIAVATEKNGTDEMRNGKAAMFVYGSWAIGTFQEDGMNFGVTTIPSYAGAEQKSVSILSSSGISMSKDSKNKEEAWEFIKYWTSEDLNKERIEYELPVLNSVVESEKIMDDELKAPFYKMLEQSAGYTPTSFAREEWSTLKDTLSLSYERIYNPSTMEDVKTVLDEAVKE